MYGVSYRLSLRRISDIKVFRVITAEIGAELTATAYNYRAQPYT